MSTCCGGERSRTGALPPWAPANTMPPPDAAPTIGTHAVAAPVGDAGGLFMTAAEKDEQEGFLEWLMSIRREF